MNNHASKDWWTEQRVEELKSRWANGETGHAIYWAMGAKSRCAVLGKAYRLGLFRCTEEDHAARSSGQRRRRAAAVTQAKRQEITRQVRIGNRLEWMDCEDAMIEEKPPDFTNPKPFWRLGAHDCHWPGDDQPGPDMLCCAAPVLNGYSYCAAHCRQAFVRPGAVPKVPR
jgi:GcrA cell cycle regulator